MSALRARPRCPAAVLPLLASFALLAGCSNGTRDLTGPSPSSSLGDPDVTADARIAPPPAAVDAPPPLIERWEPPRITIRTDGWRFAQKEGGVSLAPDRIETLEVPADVPLTFEWSARPRTGQGEINGYRWALGIDDITDETPRSGPDDLSHWSAWSLTETSATVGPFIASDDTLVIRHLYVEARDDLGFVSLVTLRLVVQRALGGDPLLVTRR